MLRMTSRVGCEMPASYRFSCCDVDTDALGELLLGHALFLAQFGHARGKVRSR